MHLSCITVVRQCILKLCYCGEAMDLKAMLLRRGDALIKLYYCGEAVHFRAVLLCGGKRLKSYATVGR